MTITEKLAWETKYLCVIDIETSGLDPDVHEILEIAALRYEFVPGPFWRESVKHTKILSQRVRHLNPVDPVVASFNGYDKATWARTADPIQEVLESLTPLMTDALILGSKPSFDLSFIMKAYDRLNWTRPKMASHHPIDVTSMGTVNYLVGDIPKLSQAELTKKFLNKKQAHSSLSDAKEIFEIFLALATQFERGYEGE